tara:strand:+ start:247 stop:453 length:207 start_codon:yes stop_codon:yes gene_type:complete
LILFSKDILMAFFTQETVEEKNNMLLIFAALLILIFSIFIIIKYETLTGVAVALGSVILAGVLIIVFI